MQNLVHKRETLITAYLYLSHQYRAHLKQTQNLLQKKNSILFVQWFYRQQGKMSLCKAHSKSSSTPCISRHSGANLVYVGLNDTIHTQCQVSCVIVTVDGVPYSFERQPASLNARCELALRPHSHCVKHQDFRYSKGLQPNLPMMLDVE